jgi:hypothetical protein
MYSPNLEEPSPLILEQIRPGRRRPNLNRRLLGLVFLGLLAGGLVLRAATVWRPIDYTSTSPWRECDLGMIARNFWRGNMNILYPQIDWGNDGPGYVESELPLLAWLMAAGYRVLGYHEEIGRVLALLISLGSLWAFYALARALLPPLQARFALMFYLFSPIMVQFATNIQPDPGMLLCSILCVHAFVRWLRDERPIDLILCALAGALAVMLKAPALCLGLVLAPLCLQKFGWRALRQGRIWALGAAMLLPGLLWYHHARGFWLTYGNSLGISNETHWIEADLLRQPRELAHLLANLVRIEAVQVFGGFGVVLGAVGLVRAWRGPRVVAWWFGAVMIFYLVALRTTGDSWAYYYHGLSVAPACLLMGLGTSPWLLGAFFAAHQHEGKTRHGGVVHHPQVRRGLGIIPALCLQALAVLALGGLAFEAVRAIDLLPPRSVDSALYPRYTAAEHLAPRIPPGARVVMVGGPGVDETGKPVAHDDGTMIFFLDRKGFVIPKEEARVEAIRKLARRGAKYLVEARGTPLAAAAGRTFRSVGAFGDYQVFAIQ